MPRGRSTSRRGLLSILAAGALGGCGLRPLYGSAEGGGVPAQLAEVNVLLIPERTGQLLRQALQTRFERGRSALSRRYDLSVQFSILSDAIAVQTDNSPSRVRLTAVANWVLVAQDAQRTTLASGSARDVDGFNIVNQQFFAAELTSASVQRRMVDAVAEQITTQLAVHFSRKAAA